MDKKAILAIGIIALFIGMAFIPPGASVDTITKKVENAKTNVEDYEEYTWRIVEVEGCIDKVTIKEYKPFFMGMMYRDVHLKGTAYALNFRRPGFLGFCKLLEVDGKTIEVEYRCFIGDISEFSGPNVCHRGVVLGVTVKVWE